MILILSTPAYSDERKLRCLYDMENQTYKMYMSIVHIDVKHTHMAWRGKLWRLRNSLRNTYQKEQTIQTGRGKGGGGATELLPRNRDN